MNTLSLIESVWRDIHYGIRQLRLNPGFAIVAILSLSLGIGANTAIFQLIDAVRLRTLPVANPHEIVDIRIADMDGARGNFGTWRPAVTNPIWERIRDEQQAFAGVFAWATTTLDLASSGPQRFTEGGLRVSGEFFNVLGVRPVVGRVFTAADDRRGCASPVAVISYAFWQREFGGDRSIVGRTVSLDRHTVEIIGVTPAGFFGLEVGHSFDVALPICADAMFFGEGSRLDSGTTWWLTVGGRLKPGSSVEQASAHVTSLSRGIFQATLPPQYPAVSVNKYLSFTLEAVRGGTGASLLRREYSTPLWLLLAIAGVVLLIACANLANLLIARASAREREIAVRLAIGASRGRVIRQLLAESLLVAAAGALAGGVLARTMSEVLVAFLSTQVNPVFLVLDADWRVLGFTAGVGLVTSLLFGLAPALRATRVSAGAALKSGGRSVTADRERFATRRVLVVAQVALSLVLLMGAFLFVGTFRNLTMLDAGFRQDGVLQADLDLRRLGLPPARRAPFRRDLLDRIRAIPGVLAAAETSIVPVGGGSSGNDVWLDGADRTRTRPSAMNWVSASYFKTLEIPLLAGRDFDDRDTPASPKVAIVNEAFARMLVDGSNPVGSRFWRESSPGNPEVRYEIVGLVKNTKYSDLRQDFGPIVFLSMAQQPTAGTHPQILIRSDAALPELMASVGGTLAGVSPDIAFHYHVFKTQIRESLMRERLMAMLSGFFGLLAAVLAMIGLYGVMSYTVSRRRNEIGVRMALGANRRDVLALVLREAAILVAIGLAIGTALSLVAARSAGALLFGMRPTDPSSLAMALGSLALVAFAASALPALRAARLEPTEALREE